MKQISFFLILLLVLLLTITSAFANSAPEISGYQSSTLKISKSYNYRTTVLGENLQPAKELKSREININYDIHLEYVFKWKLSTLMGEPVVIGWLAYKPTLVISHHSGVVLNMSSNEEALFKKVRVSEFTMNVRLYQKPKGQRAFDKGAAIVIDAGSARIPYLGHSRAELLDNKKLFDKFRSFNVSGSPDWDKLFVNIEDQQKAKKYFVDLTAASRKRHGSHSSSFYSYEVDKVGIDTSNINKYIYNYLQGLEKGIIAERNKQQEDQNKLEKEADELAAALAETEAILTEQPDFFDEDKSVESGSLEDMLEETEKIRFILNEIPRITNDNVINISGTVENISSIDSAKILFSVNGLEQPVLLKKDGSFSNKVVLFNGDNKIDINYSSAAKEENKSIIVKSNTPPVKARFTLIWDSTGSDMDLHVTGPNGDTCYFSNKSTSNMRLDVDNTTKYGPENISVKLNQNNGTYKVYVKHYGGRPGNVVLYVYLDNKLISTERSYLSGRTKWHAYDLEIN